LPFVSYNETNIDLATISGPAMTMDDLCFAGVGLFKTNSALEPSDKRFIAFELFDEPQLDITHSLMGQG